MFEIHNKIAIVTGGASGLGFRFAEELLRNGIRGLTIADIDCVSGEKAVKNLNRTFGDEKSIFIKTDVSKLNDFEEAYRKTVEKFKNVDILINNAGLTDDTFWERVVSINLNGVINGANLGLENFIKNFKSGSEGVIVNISSILGLGLKDVGYKPVYSATKAAVVSLTQSWGSPNYYERTGVRAIALCPGPTSNLENKSLEGIPEPKKITIRDLDSRVKLQSSETLAKELVRIIKHAKNGTIWVVENDEPAYEFVIPERFTFKENVLIET